jgi:hypothetical protein
MPKPLRFVDYLDGPPEFDFALLDKIDWDAACNELGGQIDPKVCDQITLVTGWYLFNSGVNTVVTPLKSMLGKLAKLRTAAEDVRFAFSKEAPPKVPFSPKRKSTQSLGRKILTKIEKRYFRLPNSEPLFYEDAVYPLLLHVIEAVIVVIAWVEIEVSDPTFPAYVKEFNWEIWIHMLTGIMKRNGLPYKVNKATLKPTQRASPFVRFVLKLQEGFPKEFKRHNTTDSVAQAIVRVRDGGISEFDAEAFINFLKRGP